MCGCFFQAEDGIRDVERSRGLGDVYKRQRGFGDVYKRQDSKFFVFLLQVVYFKNQL